MQKPPLCQKHYAIGKEMWTFPKAAADKVCSGRSGEGMLELSGSCSGGSSGLCAVRKIQHCGVGWEPDPHAHFLYSPSASESSSIPKVPLQQGKSIPFLLQLGNVGTSILLTFPRLLSQTGAAGSWSGLLIRALITPSNPPSSSKATCLRFSIFTEGIIWAYVRMCKTGRNLLFDLHREP